MNGLGCFLGKRERTCLCSDYVSNEEERNKGLLVYNWGKTKGEIWLVGVQLDQSSRVEV